MRPTPEVHDALARLLSYPGDGESRDYSAAVDVVRAALPETAAGLDAFTEGIAGLDGGELEELYTRTFDNVADRSLEVGWQLFGENYARGVLLVRLRSLLRQYGVEERTELPDHMKHVLPLLARSDEGLASALAKNQVKLATDQMLESLCTYESPWVGVLEAVQVVLRMHALETGAKEVAQ